MIVVIGEPVPPDSERMTPEEHVIIQVQKMFRQPGNMLQLAFYGVGIKGRQG